ncbi:hypothetical protein [Shewanella glacialipiscicola]|uniref:hypothetical protein n=1 Tax=Shewanella glacialipiscicola TaxID=614069 RepID=UPI003D799895
MFYSFQFTVGFIAATRSINAASGSCKTLLAASNGWLVTLVCPLVVFLLVPLAGVIKLRSSSN